MAKYINIPFAESGNKTAIPDTTTDGTVNYTDGFGGDYARPLGTDPLAKTVDRETINQALYDYGTAIKQLQENGVFPWQSTKSGGYDVGAIVSLNGVNYENTVAANTATPPNNGWKLLSDATLLNGKPSTFYLPAGDYTAADVLAKIKTVDGINSGLDTDLVRGLPADFTSSKATNGYQKLPSGLIIQWGYESGNSGSLTHVQWNITFPVAFPNALLHFSGSPMDVPGVGRGEIFIWSSPSKTGISCWEECTDGSTGKDLAIYWMAIGY